MDSKKKASATMQNLSCNRYFAKRKTSEINQQIVACCGCQKENTIYTIHRLISHLAPARKTPGGYHQRPSPAKWIAQPPLVLMRPVPAFYVVSLNDGSSKLALRPAVRGIYCNGIIVS